MSCVRTVSVWIMIWDEIAGSRAYGREGQHLAGDRSLDQREQLARAGLHIDLALLVDDQVRIERAELLGQAHEPLGIHPIVAVHDAEVPAGRNGEAGIDGGAVPAVLLGDELEDARLAVHEALRDRGGGVGGSRRRRR